MAWACDKVTARRLSCLASAFTLHPLGMHALDGKTVDAFQVRQWLRCRPAGRPARAGPRARCGGGWRRRRARRARRGAAKRPGAWPPRPPTSAWTRRAPDLLLMSVGFAFELLLLTEHDRKGCRPEPGGALENPPTRRLMCYMLQILSHLLIQAPDLSLDECAQDWTTSFSR